jgi:hypothetical protein
MVVSKVSKMVGYAVFALATIATVMLLYGISQGVITFGTALSLAGANTTLMGVAAAMVIPRNTPGLLTLVLLSVVLGGIQYAASWVI